MRCNMSKYNGKIIYTGNLMKYTNGQSVLHKENVTLAYEEYTDTFSCLDYTLNCYIGLLSDKTDKWKAEYRRIIKKHTYSYINSYDEGNIYVDENSIKVLVDSSSKHR